MTIFQLILLQSKKHIYKIATFGWRADPPAETPPPNMINIIMKIRCEQMRGRVLKIMGLFFIQIRPAINQSHLLMNKTFNERKAVSLEILANVHFDSIISIKAEQLSKALNLPFDSKTSMRDFKEALAGWIAENFSTVKSDIDGFCSSVMPSIPSKEFLASILRVYWSKINDEKVPEPLEPTYMKNVNPYMGYPMSYMYPSQPYMMPMYPPFSSEQQSYENIEKMYKMHNPYSFMQMPMQYPYSYPEGNRVPYPYSLYPQQSQQNPQNPQQQQPSTPNQHDLQYNLPYARNYYANALRNGQQPPSEVSGRQQQQQPQQLIHQITKQISTNCQSRSAEEHDHAFRYHQNMVGNRAQKGPFIIIPPCKQNQKKRQPQYHVVQNNTSKPAPPPIHKDNESSEIEVLDKNSQAVKIFKQKKNGKQTITLQAALEKKIMGDSKYDERFKNCECKGYSTKDKIYKCLQCQNMYHYSCTLKKQSSADGKVEIIDQEEEPVKESEMVDENAAAKVEKGVGEQSAASKIKEQLCHFCFMKTLDPLTDVVRVNKNCYIKGIQENKFMEYCNVKQYDGYIIAKSSPYEIQLRCMRMEDASNGIAEYTWPDQCLVTLNGEKTIQFPALQQNSSLKKRKDMSVFLTSNIFNYNKNMIQRENSRIGLQTKYISNSQLAAKKVRNNFIFILMVCLSKKKTVDELYDEIMSDPQNKVNFISHYFSTPVEEEEVAIEQIKVNLVDPFSWNLIDTPARGIYCNHGQCFDLKTFLSLMNVQKTRNWKCPICTKECRRFFVDMQQKEVIQQYKKQGVARNLSKQVTFHRDGRTLFSQQQESQNSNQKDQNPPPPAMKQQIDQNQGSQKNLKKANSQQQPQQMEEEERPLENK